MKEIRPDIFLTGAGGFLGHRLRDAALAQGLRIVSSQDGLGRLDLETPDATAALVRELQPALVLHAAAIADIGACARCPELADRVNRAAVVEIAGAAHEVGARFVFVSTDQVFDGRAAPYDEEAAPRPLHVYGSGKARAEASLLDQGGDILIVRVPLLLGSSRGARRSASDQLLDAAREGRRMALFDDEFRTPAAVGDLAAALLELARGESRGLLHLGGPERLSRWEIGLMVAAWAGLDPADFLDRSHLRGHVLAPTRPADLALDSRRARRLLGRGLKSLGEAID